MFNAVEKVHDLQSNVPLGSGLSGVDCWVIVAYWNKSGSICHFFCLKLPSSHTSELDASDPLQLRSSGSPTLMWNTWEKPSMPVCKYYEKKSVSGFKMGDHVLLWCLCWTVLSVDLNVACSEFATAACSDRFARVQFDSYISLCTKSHDNTGVRNNSASNSF